MNAHKTLSYRLEFLYHFIFYYKHILDNAHIYIMYFNIFELSFCKFCDNVWCVGKLNCKILVHLNQIRTFEIITLNLICTRKRLQQSWTLYSITAMSWKIKLNHTPSFFKTLPKRVTKAMKYIIIHRMCLSINTEIPIVYPLCDMDYGPKNLSMI
jgi:hypothetical protein